MSWGDNIVWPNHQSLWREAHPEGPIASSTTNWAQNGSENGWLKIMGLPTLEPVGSENWIITGLKLDQKMGATTTGPFALRVHTQGKQKSCQTVHTRPLHNRRVPLGLGK